MKKSLALLFIIIFVAFFFSVESKQYSPPYTPPHNPHNYYLVLDICTYIEGEGDLPGEAIEYIYGCGRDKEDLPALVLGEKYCLIVSLQPGAMGEFFESTTLVYNEEELEISEFPIIPGGMYLLSAKKECKNSIVKVFYEFFYHSEQYQIERSIYVNFSSEVNN